MRFRILYLTLMILTPSLASAIVPAALEAVYSETLTSYRSGDLPRTFQMLEELLKRAPNQREFLELKALSMRKLDCPGCSETAYEKLLLRKRSRQTVDSLEMANAQIELAALLLKKGKGKEALVLLSAAAEVPSAAPNAHFFLGTIAFRELRDAEASLQFHQVVVSKVKEASLIKPPAYFYLAKLHLKHEETFEAIGDLKLARELSGAQIDSATSDPATVDTATEVYGAASSLLGNYDRAGFFGMLTFLGGYDTNVLAAPASQVSATTTGADSVTSALQAGVGYMSSPAAEYQYVPSYRVSGNFNLNSTTKSGDFLVHDLSVYLTHHALARTQWGLRAEAIVTYQNQTDATSGNSAFKLYSYSVPFGPFMKTPLGRAYRLEAELALTAHHEYGDDSTTDDLKRSGLDTTARFSLSPTPKRKFWNPTFTLSSGFVSTAGTEYDAWSSGAELRNLIHLTDRLDTYLSAGVTLTAYTARADGTRTDQLLLLGASLVDRLTPTWSLLGTLQFYDNLSNLSTAYAYTRFAISAGVSLAF